MSRSPGAWIANGDLYPGGWRFRTRRDKLEAKILAKIVGVQSARALAEYTYTLVTVQRDYIRDVPVEPPPQHYYYRRHCHHHYHRYRCFVYVRNVARFTRERPSPCIHTHPVALKPLSIVGGAKRDRRR